MNKSIIKTVSIAAFLFASNAFAVANPLRNQVIAMNCAKKIVDLNDDESPKTLISLAMKFSPFSALTETSDISSSINQSVVSYTEKNSRDNKTYTTFRITSENTPNKVKVITFETVDFFKQQSEFSAQYSEGTSSTIKPHGQMKVFCRTINAFL